MLMQHVDGENKGKIVLFALSTCGWCKKTRMLLEDVGAEYDYVYLDLLQGDEKQEVIQQVEKWNPQLSFPTMVINDKETNVGFNEDKVREILG